VPCCANAKVAIVAVPAAAIANLDNLIEDSVPLCHIFHAHITPAPARAMESGKKAAIRIPPRIQAKARSEPQISI
jgi:hypothetical protein